MARFTGLTTASTNSMINTLLECGIVEETADVRQTGGRSSSVYQLRCRDFKMLGVQIRVDGLRCVIQDLTLNIHEIVRIDQSMEYVTAEEMVDRITDMVEELLQKANLDISDLLICSAIVPGNVDFRKGIVMDPPRLKSWKSIPLRTMLENKLGLSTVVENDNNAQALACKWKGYIKPEADAVCIGFDGGIGAGILTGGQLYRGFRGIAGELGHITVENDGLLCRCGNHSCFELYSMESALQARICDMTLQKRQGMLWEEFGENVSTASFQDSIDAARRGDEVSLIEFQRAAHYMALGISTLIKIIAPSQVILISSWLEQLKPIYFDMLDQIYKSCSFIRQSDLMFQIKDPKTMFNMASCATALEIVMTDVENNPLLKRIG